MSSQDDKIPASKVRAWLRRQGCSLEMRVAQRLTETGFEVSQFEYFVDPDTAESREIDVVASVSSQVAPSHISVAFYVECKFLTNPWVVFSAVRHCPSLMYFARLLREDYDVSDWALQGSLQGRMVASILHAMGRGRVGRYALYRMPQRPGFGIAEALTKEDRDRAYATLRQICQCIEAHDERVEKYLEHTRDEYVRRAYETDIGRGRLSLWCALGFPLIVVKGQLFDCHLAQSGEMMIAETDETALVVTNPDRRRPGVPRSCASVVRIVTEDGLARFSTDAYAAAQALMNETTAIERVLDCEATAPGMPPSEEEIPF